MGAPRIVPISDLRAGAAALVKETRQTRTPIFITQHGRATAVLMSIEEYDAADEAAMREAIRRGIAEVDAGVDGYSLDEVMERSKAIIAAHE
jgi:prevent-host-death family protein